MSLMHNSTNYNSSQVHKIDELLDYYMIKHLSAHKPAKQRYDLEALILSSPFFINSPKKRRKMLIWSCHTSSSLVITIATTKGRICPMGTTTTTLQTTPATSTRRDLGWENGSKKWWVAKVLEGPPGKLPPTKERRHSWLSDGIDRWSCSWVWRW